MKRHGFVGRFLRSVEVQEESLPLLPVLELCGDHRLLIENYLRVIGYGPDEILVVVRYGQLVIAGSDLCLRRMQGQTLVVTGEIQHISIERR